METEYEYLKLMDHEKHYFLQLMPCPTTTTFLQGDKN